MARPAFVFCDTDATLQFLLVRQIRPFQVLHDRYGIQPIIVQEVELELGSHRRFGRRIAPELKRALNNGLLKLLDKSILTSHFGGATAGALAADNAIGAIAKLGLEFDKFVDAGEAFTLAAALTLGMPALSHDASAIAALERSGFDVPSPVLRAFDLVCLCYQMKEMTEAECDGFRKALAGEGEHLPQCFKNAAFGAGLTHFVPRLTDFKSPDVAKPDALASGYARLLVL